MLYDKQNQKKEKKMSSNQTKLSCEQTKRQVRSIKIIKHKKYANEALFI